MPECTYQTCSTHIVARKYNEKFLFHFLSFFFLLENEGKFFAKHSRIYFVNVLWHSPSGTINMFVCWKLCTCKYESKHTPNVWHTKFTHVLRVSFVRFDSGFNFSFSKKKKNNTISGNNEFDGKKIHSMYTNNAVNHQFNDSKFHVILAPRAPRPLTFSNKVWCKW